ncbi:MAG: hypothetical protein KGJ06_08885 [Pseudomonadota bacterium]|nr:hypothetical protein [Pseudomonadota bacterium]
MGRKLVLLIIALTGCSTPPGSQSERFVPDRPVTGLVYDTAVGTVEGAWVAVQTPFEDINLKQKPIPEKLQQVSDNPYALPEKMLCDGIQKELAELDVVLGPDISMPSVSQGGAASRRGEYVDKGADMARERAISMVSSKVNIIPFRSIVRSLSGAEKHSKAVERAYQAGKLRRAFLKGVASALGPRCLVPPPAAFQTASVATSAAAPDPAR